MVRLYTGILRQDFTGRNLRLLRLVRTRRVLEKVRTNVWHPNREALIWHVLGVLPNTDIHYHLEVDKCVCCRQVYEIIGS